MHRSLNRSGSVTARPWLAAFISSFLLLALMAGSLVAVQPAATATSGTAGSGTYADLVALFHEWRDFESPPRFAGAPDYRAETMRAARAEFDRLRARLDTIDPSDWPVAQQVDFHLVRAELNGFDFNLRVLKPWARDPAFYQSVWSYQSDTPAHEGPTNHALVELWTYDFPLSAGDAKTLRGEIETIAPLLAQARGNLTGDARELWLSGIGNLRDQADTLADLASRIGDHGDLASSVRTAEQASRDFVVWLESEAPKKQAPSGIGKENYTWYLQNVHLVPMSWEDEVRMLERELYRAHTSLRLEEHRNRDLPPLRAIADETEYDRRANEAVRQYIAFLDDEDILTVRDYMDPALRARIGSFVPENERNFFRTAIHFEPMTLWTHFYHWWDLARMEAQPHVSPIRRGPLLYNIFDSRAEGLSTGMEEMVMHAGLYDDNPRVREIVWIMLAQRAARGLGSLYVHANEMTMKEARDFHVRWTPRGWMREDLDLLGFEQQLYLRQPGYGTSYITGKIQLEQLMMERAEQLGDAFSLKRWFEEVDALGVIPVSLIRWQLTGNRHPILRSRP